MKLPIITFLKSEEMKILSNIKIPIVMTRIAFSGGTVCVIVYTPGEMVSTLFEMFHNATPYPLFVF